MRKPSVLFQFGIVAGGLLLIVIANLISFFLYQSNEELLAQAQEKRYEFSQLVQELRNSSDNLTQLARMYVVTGNAQFSSMYWDVYNIRNGSLPRTHSYNLGYWNYLAPGTPSFSGKKISLIQLMRQAGIPDEELARLQKAEANSNALMQREIAVMNMVKQEAPTKDERFSEKRTMAINELFSDHYYQLKSAIMSPIGNFDTMLGRHTEEFVNRTRQNIIFYRVLVIVFQCLLFLLAVGIGWFLLRNIYRNEKKWTKPLIDTGMVAVPGIIVEKQVALGLDAIDMNIILYLSYSWQFAQHLPSPTVDDIAKNIGLGVRTVQKHISALQAAGLLTRIQRCTPGQGNTANLYSLEGLIKAALLYTDNHHGRQEKGD